MNQRLATGLTLLFLILAFASAAAEDNSWLAANMRLWQILFLSLAAAGGMITAVHFHTSARPDRLQTTAIGLIALTGMIHFYLGIRGDWLLLANGLGFFALLCALYFPIAPLAAVRRPLLGVLLLYTLVTFVGYFVSHTPAAYDAVGLASKGLELALMAVLAVALRQKRPLRGSR